jgi:hypothetical protein
MGALHLIERDWGGIPAHEPALAQLAHLSRGTERGLALSAGPELTSAVYPALH